MIQTSLGARRSELSNSIKKAVGGKSGFKKDVFWSGDFGGIRLTNTFLCILKAWFSLSDGITSFPELQDFMDMQDNVKLYFKICINILQPATKSLLGLMTEKDWASLALQCDREGQGFDFNSLVHPSTEAFFLLIIKNNHERWKKMYVHKK